MGREDPEQLGAAERRGHLAGRLRPHGGGEIQQARTRPGRASRRCRRRRAAAARPEHLQRVGVEQHEASSPPLVRRVEDVGDAEGAALGETSRQALDRRRGDVEAVIFWPARGELRGASPARSHDERARPEPVARLEPSRRGTGSDVKVGRRYRPACSGLEEALFNQVSGSPREAPLARVSAPARGGVPPASTPKSDDLRRRGRDALQPRRSRAAARARARAQMSGSGRPSTPAALRRDRGELLDAALRQVHPRRAQARSAPARSSPRRDR